MSIEPVTGRLATHLGTCAAILVGASALALSGTPAASAAGTYLAQAHADAVELSYGDPSVPVFPDGRILAASPATADATVDSSGASRGYASAPSPGRDIAALPGVANGATPGAPFPAYPFSVASEYPSEPSVQQVQGPFAISAVSGPARSQATAHAGGASGTPAFGSAWSKATAGRDDGGAVTATAEADLNGFAAGSTVSIGRIVSRASIVSVAGRPAVKEASFSAMGLSVAGVTVGVDDQGIKPVPGTPPGLDRTALQEVLATAGVTIAYMPATDSPTSVESAGLVVSLITEVPGRGPILSRFTLGKVRAAAETADDSTGSTNKVAGGGAQRPETTSPGPPSSAAAGSSIPGLADQGTDERLTELPSVDSSDADRGSSPLSITEIPQLTAGVGAR